MRALIPFAAGAVMAATTVYFVMKKEPAPLPVPEQPVVQAPIEPEVSPPAPATEPGRVVQKPAPPVRPGTKGRASPVAVAAPAPEPPAPQEPPAPPEIAVEQTPAPPPAAVSAPEPAPPPREPNKVTLLPGTLVTVRLSERLASDKNAPGDLFAATLDQPLIADGFVIAERGARVEGKVAEVQEAGRVKGLATLSVQLVALKISDGQQVGISTDPFEKKASSEKREDAAKVGAAAAIGAAIGAIAGGGKGAAIGAGVGGAAGSGAVLATRGKPAELEAETRITFRLNSPVTIVEKL